VGRSLLLIQSIALKFHNSPVDYKIISICSSDGIMDNDYGPAPKKFKTESGSSAALGVRVYFYGVTLC
jgi:hypothetical protein